jgi:hypothetical protein
MKTIRIPKERAYYLASQNESQCLLCWIPVQDYDHLAQEGRIPRDVLADYPDGLEVEVSTPGFGEFQIDLGVGPEAIKQAYAELAARGLLPSSGAVAGSYLEGIARSIEGGAPELARRSADVAIGPAGERLPEPAMTEGEDATVVMRDLQ